MSKALKTVLIAAGGFALLFGLLIGSIVYKINYQITGVGREQSPDGVFEILFQAVGEPDFPFGKTDVQVLVQKTGGGLIDKAALSIYNDGKSFTESCWEVSWKCGSVDITLKGEEQSDYTYTVRLE